MTACMGQGQPAWDRDSLLGTACWVQPGSLCNSFKCLVALGVSGLMQCGWEQAAWLLPSVPSERAGKGNLSAAGC